MADVATEPVSEPHVETTPEIDIETPASALKNKGKRTFTVSESSVELKGGRYVSKSATQAAQKAAKQLFRKVPETQTNEIEFVLRELKPRVKGVKIVPKRMKYQVTRVLRDEPLRVMLDGNEVLIKYKFHIKPLGRLNPDGTLRKGTHPDNPEDDALEEEPESVED